MMFRDGGPFMFLILFAHLLATPVVLMAWVAVFLGRLNPGRSLTVARALAVMGVLVSFLAPCAGTLGWQQGRMMTEQAVVNASPEMKDLLREKGYEISRYPLDAALLSASCTTLPAFLALFVAFLPARRDYAAMAEEDDEVM